jgi:hypothetical protein
MLMLQTLFAGFTSIVYNPPTAHSAADCMFTHKILHDDIKETKNISDTK